MPPRALKILLSGLLPGGLLLCGLLAIPPRPASAAEAPFGTAALLQRLAAIPERHDSFQEEKTLAALAYPLRSRGQLLFRRPAHLEKNTLSPQPEKLVVDGDQLTIDSGSGGPHVLSLAEHPDLAALIDSLRGTLAGDLPALERSFRVESSGSFAAWRLTLTPARPELAQLVRTVAIAGAETRFRTIDVTQANGDRQLLTIDPPS